MARARAARKSSGAGTALSRESEWSPMVALTTAVSGGRILEPFEQGREGLAARGLGIGAIVLAQLPRRGEAPGIEPGEQMIGSPCPPDRAENVRGTFSPNHISSRSLGTLFSATSSPSCQTWSMRP